MRLCARRISITPLTRLPNLHAPAFPLTRSFPRMASSAFQFAEGEDAQQLARDADALLQQGWAQDGDGMGVTKTFHFKSYFKAVVGYYFLLFFFFFLLFLVWSGVKTGAASIFLVRLDKLDKLTTSTE